MRNKEKKSKQEISLQTNRPHLARPYSPCASRTITIVEGLVSQRGIQYTVVFALYKFQPQCATAAPAARPQSRRQKRSRGRADRCDWGEVIQYQGYMR